MPNPKSEARNEYIRLLASDYLFFVRELWKSRGLDRMAPIGELEEEMLTWMCSGPRMRGILGTRGMGKTTLLVAPLVVYRLFRDPDRKILIVSKSAQAAKETIGLCRSWIDDVWFLKHLKPTKDQSDNTNEFSVAPCTRGMSKQPSVKAMGNDGQLEGNRAHTYICDDAETKQNTRTNEARDELMRTVANEATNIVYAVDTAIDPTELIDIGTFKHEDSFHKKLAMRGYQFRTYPIAYPQEGDQFIGLSPILQRRLTTGEAQYTKDGKYDENPTFPHFFKPEIIRERMGAGLLDFGMENMLLVNPGKQAGPPLKLRDLIVMPIERDQAPIRVTKGAGIPIGDIPCEGLIGDALYGPESTDTIRAPFQAIEATIDIAGEGNDLMGVSIIGYLNGMYFLKHCRGYPGGASEDQMNDIAALLKKHGARRAWVETNIDILGTFVPALQNACNRTRLSQGANPDIPQGWSCSVEGFHSTGMKEQRICTLLGPIISGNKVVVDPSVLKPDPTLEAHQTFQYQISRIRPIRKWLKEDGPIDSFASGVMKLQDGTAGNRIDPNTSREQQQKLRTKALVAAVRAKAGLPRELVQTISLN